MHCSKISQWSFPALFYYYPGGVLALVTTDLDELSRLTFCEDCEGPLLKRLLPMEKEPFMAIGCNLTKCDVSDYRSTQRNGEVNIRGQSISDHEEEST